MTHNADLGPAANPPAWCEPGTQPAYDKLTPEYGGGPVAMWCRDFGRDVWIEGEDHVVDGRWVRRPPRIMYSEPTTGLDAAAACRLAAELLNAADTLGPTAETGR